MLASAAVLASESAVVTELPIPPLAYGLLTFGALMALLCVTFAFRSLRDASLTRGATRQGDRRR